MTTAVAIDGSATVATTNDAASLRVTRRTWAGRSPSQVVLGITGRRNHHGSVGVDDGKSLRVVR